MGGLQGRVILFMNQNDEEKCPVCLEMNRKQIDEGIDLETTARAESQMTVNNRQ